MVHVEADNKMGSEGPRIINEVLKREKAVIKEVSLKIGAENELTKACAQNISTSILDCVYLSKLSFDIQYTFNHIIR